MEEINLKKKGFFSVKEVRANDSTVSYVESKKRFVFFGKMIESSIDFPVSSLIYCEQVRNHICFGDGTTSISAPFKKSNVAHAVEVISKVVPPLEAGKEYFKTGIKESLRNAFLKKKDKLVLCNDVAYGFNYSFFGKTKLYTNKVLYKDVCFLDVYSKIIGGKTLYFGQWNTIFFDHMTSANAKEAEAFIRPLCPKLNVATEDFKVFRLKFWRKEIVRFSDEAIIHNMRVFGKTRTSYVPYNEIDMAYYYSGKLFLSGSLEFCMEGRFYFGKAKRVGTLLKERIKVDDGKVFYPNIFSGVKGRRKHKLIVSDKGILYYLPKDSPIAQMIKSDEAKKSDEFYCIRTVTSYRCKPIFSLFKRVLTIEGDTSVDLRTKQAYHVVIVFPGVCFFWGRLKRAIKALM